MKYGLIPGVDKKASHVAQGCVMLNTRDLDGSMRLLDAAYEAGINTFDSAHIYGGGECDRALGRWVAQRGLRDRIVLMDKCCHHNADRRRVTPFDLTADLHDCLARLKFDYIDVFATHRDDPTVPVEPIVERFNQHVREGKILAFGASNWTHQRLREANEFAAANGLKGFTVSSPHYSLAECIGDPWGGGSVSITAAANADARAWYEANTLALLPWSSLSGGFFSGRFRRDNLATFTDGGDQRCVRCYCCEDNFRRYDRAAKLAAERGATVPQIALAYTICGPFNCFPLMAAWTPEQARENAQAADIELSERELAWLDLRADDR